MKLIGDFNEIPPLESLTASQVVITIWNRKDIVRSITLALTNQDEKEVVLEWRHIHERVFNSLQCIKQLPPLLKEDLEEIIIPIGRHIKAMRIFADFSPYLESTIREFPVNLWTHYGTVDTKQLNQMLVQDGSRLLGFRYNLACHNCFENIIMELFTLLSDMQKLRFLHIERNRELVSYWTHRIVKNTPFFLNLALHQFEESSIDDEIAFKYTLMNGSKSGIDYFMSKFEYPQNIDVIQKHLFSLLNPLQNPLNRCSIPIRRLEHFSDALYFLLSKLSEQGYFVSNNFCYGILVRFLMFPFFGLFDTLRKKWQENLNVVAVEDLLSRIVRLMYARTSFFGYELFFDFWYDISEEFQITIKEQSKEDNLLLYEKILDAEERQNLEIIY